MNKKKGFISQKKGVEKERAKKKSTHIHTVTGFLSLININRTIFCITN